MFGRKGVGKEGLHDCRRDVRENLPISVGKTPACQEHRKENLERRRGGAHGLVEKTNHHFIQNSRSQVDSERGGEGSLKKLTAI